MKKVGFIGAYDKTDFILYIARTLVEMGKKVIVVDTTITQRARYVVPAISPSISYITEYEGIDVTVGLYSYEEIAQYIGTDNLDNYGYDYILIDIDNAEELEKFNLYTSDINYFVTSFDLYSLKRGVEILEAVRMPLQLTKILFSKYMTKEEDDYLNYLSMGSKIQWNEERIYFPFENGDQSAIAENQRISKLKIKGLSTEYRESIIYMVDEITGENDSTVRRALKQI